jgi:2-phosphosulfolactate phosphatase
MKLFVYHTPEQVPSATDGDLATQPDCAIAVDILRATTTIATALAAGAEAIQVFADLALLEDASGAWSPELSLRAGERGGSTVPGYDLGNSPFDYSPDVVSGKRIFMSTTNGTRALTRVHAAPTVMTAAFVNIGAIVRELQTQGFETVWIVGSGWEGAFSLEDAACSGAIAYLLQQSGYNLKLGNDEAVAAIALYKCWQDNLVDLLRSASHGQRLLRLGRDEDLEYCASLNRLDVIPHQSESGVLVA